MWNKIWPLLLIIGSNTFYNICTKSMPENINPFGALVVTYLTGALLSLILFLSTTSSSEPFSALIHFNWIPIVLGFSIVGLEAGYVYLYRAGWEISVGSLTANLLLAIVLLIIGLLFYKEVLTLKQILGIIVCCVGLVLLSR